MTDYEDREQRLHDARMGRLAREKDIFNGLIEACNIVLAEARERVPYESDDWNLDHHVFLSLSIGEIKKIHDAVANARGNPT